MPPDTLSDEQRLSEIEWHNGTQSEFWNTRFLPWISDGLALAVQTALDTKRPISERDKACGAVEVMNRILSLKEGYEQSFAELKASEASAVRQESEPEAEMVGPKASDQWYEGEGRE
jgi:hypothetical protein